MEIELEQVIGQLKDKAQSVEMIRPRRWFVECLPEDLLAVCRFLFEQAGLRFVISTGIDADQCFEVLHHFSHDSNGSLVTVKVRIPDKDNPRVDSIAQFIPAAEWIEREIKDLLGIRFVNHPNPDRLILADDWPEGVYPLRKDYKP